MWSKGMLVFGLCGKDKSDTPLQPYKLNYVHGAKEKKKKVHIYSSANNRILIPENGKQF